MKNEIMRNQRPNKRRLIISAEAASLAISLSIVKIIAETQLINAVKLLVYVVMFVVIIAIVLFLGIAN